MIGVDIGGSHISSIEILDILNGEVNGQLHTTRIDMNAYSQDDVLDLWSNNIQSTISTASTFEGSIAVAIPGPFNYSQGIVFSHLNAKFKPIEGLNLRAELSKRIKDCKQIYFDNDAACFGLGEYYYGLHPRHSRMLAITLGSGIGSSFISDGAVITDKQLVPEGGEVYHLSYKEAKADDYFSTRWFVEKAREYDVNIAGVKELVHESPPEIKEAIFEEFHLNLFEFLLPIVLKFDATAIIIGGNIAKAWKYFGQELASNFQKIGVEVRPSTIGEKGICLGATRSLYNYMTHEDSNLSR